MQFGFLAVLHLTEEGPSDKQTQPGLVQLQWQGLGVSFFCIQCTYGNVAACCFQINANTEGIANAGHSPLPLDVVKDTALKSPGHHTDISEYGASSGTLSVSFPCLLWDKLTLPK